MLERSDKRKQSSAVALGFSICRRGTDGSPKGIQRLRLDFLFAGAVQMEARELPTSENVTR